MFTLYAVFLYVVSVVISSVISNKLIGVDCCSRRNRSVDGLRGILATMVVLFHFIATYNIETFGKWAPPPYVPLSNTGSISVTLFFMISGYLFFNVINKVDVDWRYFFLARLLRVYPLYIFILIPIICIAYNLGDDKMSSGVRYWLVFLNTASFGYKDAYLINAGVHWTLLYEVLFYITLPLLWCLRFKTFTKYSLLFLIVVLVAYLDLSTGFVHWSLFAMFFGGGMCHFLSKASLVMNNKFFVGLLGILSIMAAFYFTSSYSFMQFLLLVIPFLAVINGVGLFSCLNSKYLVSLGSASYSIYLIHGVVLFLAFRSGVINVSEYSIDSFMPMIIPVIIITSLLSCFTYKYIESPCVVIYKKINGSCR